MELLETFCHEQGEEDFGYVTEQYLDNLASQIPTPNRPAATPEKTND